MNGNSAIGTLARALLLGVLLSGTPAGAQDDAIYARDIRGDFEVIYQRLHGALEAARFYVVFEAHISKNLERNAQRWGDDYNRNGFEVVRSMVICNPWYANQLLNLQPDLMALCPMTVTVLYRAGSARVLFERLVPVARGGPAEELLWEVENTIIAAIEGVSAD